MAHPIRPIRMDDAAGVGALLDWAWFAPRSEAGWRWLCRTPRSQPARAIPVGFVAEDGDGRVAGVFGLFTQDYAARSGPAIGATAHTLIVHPRIKGASAGLVDAVLDQAGPFGVSVFNGNARAAPIYARHGMKAWPSDRGDLSLVWVTDPLAVLAARGARAAQERKGEDARRPVERFMRERVFTPDLVRLGDRVRQLSAADVDARFDAFWSALAAEGRLTARRDAASYRWRMTDPDRTREPLLLAWMDGEAIGGLLLAQVVKVSEIDFPSLEIIDLVALEACAGQAMHDLASAMHRNVSRLGAAKMRLSVATEEMEERLSKVPGMIRRRSHLHGHVRFAPGGEDLARDWRLTPYDADHGFCLRAPPAPARLVQAA